MADTTYSIRNEAHNYHVRRQAPKTIGLTERMASAEKIRARIKELGTRPKNVTLSDIEWVMTQLDQFAQVTLLKNVHAYMWTVDGEPFSVCTHHKGSKQLKPVYIKNFLNAMITTGWYE